MATSWSTASGRESDKQGKDGASSCGNEVKEEKKIKDPAERKEEQDISTISLFLPLLPTSSFTKETASHYTDKRYLWTVKTEGKSSIQNYYIYKKSK